jgi:hypothetical protein
MLESVWKVVSMVIKNRMAASISFDNTLHGFRAHRGTGTTTLEARLHLDPRIQQGRMLFQIFLDLSKAYDTLDWARTLELLQSYGMGPRLLGLLRNVWGVLQLVPHQGGFTAGRFGASGEPRKGTRCPPSSLMLWSALWSGASGLQCRYPISGHSN